MEDLLIFLGIVVVSVAWEKLKKAISGAAEASAPKPRQASREEEAAPEAEVAEEVPEEVPAEPRGWNDVPAWEEESAEEPDEHEEPEYIPSQPDPSPVPEARSGLEEILRRLAEAQTVEAEPEEAPATDEEAVPSPAAAREETGSLEDDRPIWELHSEEEAAREAHPSWEPRAGLRSPLRAETATGRGFDRAGLENGILWSVVLGEPRGRRWMRVRK